MANRTEWFAKNLGKLLKIDFHHINMSKITFAAKPPL